MVLKKTTRKETRKRLKELKLAVTLSKVINHFFTRQSWATNRFWLRKSKYYSIIKNL